MAKTSRACALPGKTKASAVASQASAASTLEFVADKARNMSPEEFRRSLVRAGIIDTGGKLTTHYVSKKK